MLLLGRIRETDRDHSLSLERVSYRKGDQIASEISGRKDVLHCPVARVLMVTVVIPKGSPRPIFREPVIQPAEGMEPFRIERPGVIEIAEGSAATGIHESRGQKSSAAGLICTSVERPSEVHGAPIGKFE